MTDVIELLRKALDEHPDEVREALTLRPCHVTGMHKPNHHTEYTCEIQQAQMMQALMSVVLGEDVDREMLTAALPHGLHKKPCWNCHEIPTQEVYRIPQRASYEWAGVEVPPALAEVAKDGYHEGDEEVVLGIYEYLDEQKPGHYWTRFEMRDLIQARGFDWDFVRMNLSERRLVEAGKVEHLRMSNPLSSRLVK